jgi:glycosyltransferase involved in cell wall biosynthesis
MSSEVSIPQSKVPVSFLVPIKNEAANLPRCLQSITWAAEIFVVDSGSTDASEEIARSFGAKVVQFHFAGTWPKKKNWALDNLPFSYDWVFILDADEVLPPEARDEILDTITHPAHEGYWINRRFFFLGSWLKHAYFPNWNLRLFKHRLGRYEMLTNLDTASGDNEVHEHIVLNGSSGRLKALMDHYAFPTVEIFIEKHNRYSNWEAKVALGREPSDNQKSRSGENTTGALRLRRYFKNLSRRLPCRPLLRFLYVYVWQKGFLDGLEGYYFACMHALYEFLIVIKTFELRKKEKSGVNR